MPSSNFSFAIVKKSIGEGGEEGITWKEKSEEWTRQTPDEALAANIADHDIFSYGKDIEFSSQEEAFLSGEMKPDS